jgi:hypothetical protein
MSDSLAAMSVIASSQVTGSKPSGPRRTGVVTVGIVDNLGERDALLAGQARRQRMFLVGPKRDQSAVLDGGHHAAQWLADAAEGRLVLDHRIRLL